MTCDETKPLLDAHLDGELDPARRIAIDSHLKTCAGCREDFERIKSLSNEIRGSNSRYEAPAHLRDNIRFALRGAEYLERRPRRAQWNAWTAAAAIVAVAALGSAPFLVSARNQRQALAAEIVSAHERALAGRELDVVSTDRHTVKPWFNGKLAFSPPVVDLSTEGFPLQGGRLDYIGTRPLAVLVYARRLHRIDVFVWPAESEMPPARFDRNGFHEISWTKNNFAFTCVSDLDPVELNAFVNLLKSQS
jgi:anti-sigma factor RsiW